MEKGQTQKRTPPPSPTSKTERSISGALAANMAADTSTTKKNDTPVMERPITLLQGLQSAISSKAEHAASELD